MKIIKTYEEYNPETHLKIDLLCSGVYGKKRTEIRNLSREISHSREILQGNINIKFHSIGFSNKSETPNLKIEDMDKIRKIKITNLIKFRKREYDTFGNIEANEINDYLDIKIENLTILEHLPLRIKTLEDPLAEEDWSEFKNEKFGKFENEIKKEQKKFIVDTLILRYMETTKYFDMFFNNVDNTYIIHLETDREGAKYFRALMEFYTDIKIPLLCVPQYE